MTSDGSAACSGPEAQPCYVWKKRKNACPSEATCTSFAWIEPLVSHRLYFSLCLLCVSFWVYVWLLLNLVPSLKSRTRPGVKLTGSSSNSPQVMWGMRASSLRLRHHLPHVIHSLLASIRPWWIKRMRLTNDWLTAFFICKVTPCARALLM